MHRLRCLLIRRCAGWIVLAGFLPFMATACSRETLSIFFDGVPKPGEEKQVKKPQRRSSPEEIARASKPVAPDGEKPAETLHVSPSEERLPAERSTRWEMVEPLLPKDAQGNIDWVKALDEGTIKPRSSLDLKTPELEALPLKVELVPEGRPEFRVVFRHEVHTRLLACDACHPRLFVMQKGADPITMEKIYAGEYCGRCHGTVAFAVEPNCARCHQALGGGS